jgi:NAD(P)-dependent dehydrogenase (short-subunit alcohol dehydrogenase family)
MSTDQTTQQNPTERGPRPPFPRQEQPMPGQEERMQPKADHGEETYKGSGRLQGKRAIITGGDSGIGKAIAIAFAREGADVLISYLNEEQDAMDTIRWIEQAGRKAVAVAGDIGQEAHCQETVRRATQALGGLDLLVNNAAFQKTYQSIEEITAADLEHTFRTNIFAMFYLCKAALPVMREGGAVINTASIQAYQPSANLLAYAATKGAIVNFTKGLSEEAIKRGIRVNAVAPGPVWTPLIPSTMPPERTSQFGKDTPMGRPAQPVELAPAFVFLASNESSFITGEIIGVTGGKPLS